MASAIVNNMRATFVHQDIEKPFDSKPSTLSFLDQQLPELRKQLDASEQRYNTFRNRTARST